MRRRIGKLICWRRRWLACEGVRHAGYDRVSALSGRLQTMRSSNKQGRLFHRFRSIHSRWESASTPNSEYQWVKCRMVVNEVGDSDRIVPHRASASPDFSCETGRYCSSFRSHFVLSTGSTGTAWKTAVSLRGAIKRARPRLTTHNHHQPSHHGIHNHPPRNEIRPAQHPPAARPPRHHQPRQADELSPRRCLLGNGYCMATLG